MKRILATTAIVLATATAASAQDREQLMGAIQSGLEPMGFQVDYDALSDEQLVELNTMLTGSGDNNSNEQEVRSYLIQADALEEGASSDSSGAMASDSGAASDEETVSVDMPRSQLEAQVANALSGMPQVEAEASELSNKELSQVYLVIAGGMDQQDQAKRINTILGDQ